MTETERKIFDRMYEALNLVWSQCLFEEDGGAVGVATDVVIDEELFDEICSTLVAAKPDERLIPA